MSDLVQRLRTDNYCGLCDDAADRIEALERIHALWADQEAKQHQAKDARITNQQQRIEALEAALREIAAHSSLHDAIAERIARRALESKTV
jgi:hypothetical protein